MTEVDLWLKPDVFAYGILYAHPKLTISYLKKVLSYAKGKKDGFPILCWSVWKHMAVNKMLMPEDLAWTYFQLYFTLMNKSVKEHIEFAELRQQISEAQDSKSYKDHMKLPTLEFVLFLFLQQANKTSLRKSLLGEEWPGTSPRFLDSPSHSNRSEGSYNICDERKHIQYIISNFSKIIDLFSDGSKEVSTDIVKAFNSVICGRILQQSAVCTLFEIATRSRIQVHSGYIRSSGKFSCHVFVKWLTHCLVENPYGFANCLNFGTRLNWFSHSQKLDMQRKKARIATNALTAPSDQKNVIFVQCSNQTVARQTPILNGASIKICRCHSSYIYLLSPLKCVSIENCTDTCVVLGPVSTCIKLIGCHSLTVISPCRSMIISSSTNVKLHITTPNQPIVLHEQSISVAEPPVTFAPYNTFYADLEKHLAMVGLAISSNTDQWNRPLCIGCPNSNLNHSRSVSSMSTPVSALSITENENFFTIMNPTDFYTFSIPFKTPSVQEKNSEKPYVTVEIPGGLPDEYAKAVKSKQRATERWRQAVKKSNMTKEDRKQFQKLVEEKFKDWVSETNNQRQLDDLGPRKVSTTDEK